MWKDELIELSSRLEHPAWGIGHSRRVHDLALDLARRAGLAVDADIVCAAACLHDIGAFPEYRRPGADHADRSVEVAGAVLARIGFPADRLPEVLRVIAGHMFYRHPADSPEAVVFHDADVLEFMGYIGVTRMLAIVGLDDWAPDVRAAVDRIVRFSGELPGSLATEPARALGRVRLEEMTAYLAGLAEATNHLMEL